MRFGVYCKQNWACRDLYGLYSSLCNRPCLRCLAGWLPGQPRASTQQATLEPCQVCSKMSIIKNRFYFTVRSINLIPEIDIFCLILGVSLEVHIAEYSATGPRTPLSARLWRLQGAILKDPYASTADVIGCCCIYALLACISLC